MTGLVEHVRLMQGTGEAWIEPQFNQIDAQYINVIRSGRIPSWLSRSVRCGSCQWHGVSRWF